MTSIKDFSEAPKHTIKKVSLQTGIPPVTLRAWERRYQILSPGRSANKYRLYSDRDVATLRWLKGQVAAGINISTAISKFNKMVASGTYPEVLPIDADIESLAISPSPDKFSRELYLALLHHDEIEADYILREVFSLFDLKSSLIHVITPCLVDIGEAWYRGEIRITTEHFATAFIRGKLLGLLQAYPYQRNATFIMLGGAPNEQHEIGALMLAVLLRSNGYRVEFLGPDLPLDDLVEHARFEKPFMIILTASTREAALELKFMQDKLRKLHQHPIFGFGGRAFLHEPSLRQQIPGVYLGDTLDSAIPTIVHLVEGQKK